MATSKNKTPRLQALEQFIRLTLAAGDTATLVKIVASHRKRIGLCRKLVQKLSENPTGDPDIRSVCQRAGTTPRRLLERLKPVVKAFASKPPRNHYERLCIPHDATTDEIRRAYRRQARVLHPDRNPDGGDSTLSFIHLTTAYQTLSHPRQRAEYDRLLTATHPVARRAFEVAMPEPPPPRGARFPVGLVILLFLLIIVAFSLDFIHRHGGLSRPLMVSLPSPPSEGAPKTAVFEKGAAERKQAPRTPLADDRSGAPVGTPPQTAANPVNSSARPGAGHLQSQHERTKRAADAPRPKTQALTQQPLSAVKPSPPSLDDARPRLINFLHRYCRAYESRDLRQLAGLFHAEAQENGQPFESVLPLYRSNLERLDALAYRIELDHYEQQRTPRGYIIKGRFFASARIANKGIRESRGTIDMTLVAQGSTFLVKRLDYAVIY